MKQVRLIAVVGAVLIGTGLGTALWAAEDDPAAPLRRQRREQIRERRDSLSPEQREARRKEFRNRGERTIRKSGQVTAEQRQQVGKERREKMNAQFEELRKKKADGTLTDRETRRLEHMERVIRDGGPVPGGTGRKAKQPGPRGGGGGQGGPHGQPGPHGPGGDRQS